MPSTPPTTSATFSASSYKWRLFWPSPAAGGGESGPRRGAFATRACSATGAYRGRELPSYRGDIVNDIALTTGARRPDPERQIMAYRQSAATLNLLRAFAGGGYANLEHVHRWTLGFLNGSPASERYQDLADRITEALGFMRACGITSDTVPQLRSTEFFTSHEALLLGYEQAMTRVEFHERRLVRHVGTHAVDRRSHPAAAWRTRGVLPRGEESRWTEMRAIARGGRSCELIDTLNPENEPGRLTLITRYGHDRIERHLPEIIRAVKGEGRAIVWSCDPMHGNTIETSTGYKTRRFEQVMSEVRKFMDIHQAEGTHAGGIHVEMTGKNVTECTGGFQAVTEVDLKDRYHTFCDPRLNAAQALELAFLVAQEMKEEQALRPRRELSYDDEEAGAIEAAE